MTIEETLLKGISDYYNNVVIQILRNNQYFSEYDITTPIGIYLYYYIIGNCGELDQIRHSSPELFSAKTLADVLKYMEKFR